MSQGQELDKLAIRLANAAVLPMVMKSAIELNLIDIISGSGDGVFLSRSDIASRLPTKNPEAPVLLDRMLRLLASHDILKCKVRTGENGQVERLYAAAPICKFFVKNEDGGSVASLLQLHHDKAAMEGWHHLSDSILEGGTPFSRAYGLRSAFEYIERDPNHGQFFNKAMSDYTTLIMKKMVDVYKGFQNEGLKVLVDVGGGIGANLGTITSKHPHIKGINFDLPHVVAHAPPITGVEHVGGDMFKKVPKGDAICLKTVLHDWGDEDCVKILKKCFEALPKSGKVIITELIVPEIPENTVSSNIACELDLLMMVVHPGGRERTLKEFEALALKSGFSKCQVICPVYTSWVLEFRK
ncbi:caffeic acid 3-O-methyltransferase-like isoform X2 [Pistacia vera]|uniref:caffeic acid 3-O-methyltransferase-like isoform X2 n=1 Tax=Pistacia vera TaxID=55513 RepID=UPI0012633C5E|nr:caffeic acid 3-O-methyltransferase-like isoform X2 [Pistacia vera]